MGCFFWADGKSHSLLQRLTHMTVGQKLNGDPEWNPGKWNPGQKPAVPWWLNLDPHPYPSDGKYASTHREPCLPQLIGGQVSLYHFSWKLAWRWTKGTPVTNFATVSLAPNRLGLVPSYGHPAGYPPNKRTRIGSQKRVPAKGQLIWTNEPGASGDTERAGIWGGFPWRHFPYQT